VSYMFFQFSHISVSVSYLYSGFIDSMVRSLSVVMIIFTQGNDSKWDKVLPKSGIRNILDRWQDPSGGL